MPTNLKDTKKTVVIDPGHGGKDPGAVGNGLLEKEITLDISLQVAKCLKQQYTCPSGSEPEVHLTRSDDIYMSLTERADFANRLKANFFISIHSNAGGGTGFESYIHTSQNPVTEEMRQAVHNTIMDYLAPLGIRDRGPKSANFAVLRQTAMPAVLVENLFIDTLTDVDFLKDNSFRSDLAVATARGIATAVNLKEKQPNVTPPENTGTWDPAGEIAKLKESGLINTLRQPNDNVNWGEFATIMNRLLDIIKK